jgi:hypothetical protein
MKHKNLLLTKNNTLLYSDLFNDRFDSRDFLSFFDFLHLQFFTFLTSIILFLSKNKSSLKYSKYEARLLGIAAAHFAKLQM